MPQSGCEETEIKARKPCCHTETTRCRSCSFRFKIRQRHSLFSTYGFSCNLFFVLDYSVYRRHHHHHRRQRPNHCHRRHRRHKKVQRGLNYNSYFQDHKSEMWRCQMWTNKRQLRRPTSVGTGKSSDAAFDPWTLETVEFETVKYSRVN